MFKNLAFWEKPWYERPLVSRAENARVLEMRGATRDQVLVHRVLCNFSTIIPSEVLEMLNATEQALKDEQAIFDEERMNARKEKLEQLKSQTPEQNQEEFFSNLWRTIIERSVREIGEGIFAWMRKIPKIEKLPHDPESSTIASVQRHASTVLINKDYVLDAYENIQATLNRDLHRMTVILHEYMHLHQKGYLSKNPDSIVQCCISIAPLAGMLSLEPMLFLAGVIGWKLLGKHDYAQSQQPENETGRLFMEQHAYFRQNPNKFWGKDYLIERDFLQNQEDQAMFACMSDFLEKLYALGATDKEVGKLIFFALWDKKTQSFPNMKHALDTLQAKRGFSDDQLENLVQLYFQKHRLYLARLYRIAAEEVEKVAI